MTWTLSIDFGTTNTAAAVSRDGRPASPVRLTGHGDLMPSAVVAHESGIRTSVRAENSMAVFPEAYVASPKRLVGLDTVLLGERDVPVGDLVSAVLSEVASVAATREGGTLPDQVILTHPQEWAPPRRQALVDAWRATAYSGDGELRLVSEPIAAARALAHDATLPDQATIAVLDYGGGTCDVAVLRRERPDDSWTVLAHGGNDRGGTDIDVLLLDWVRAELRASEGAALDEALDHPRHLGAFRTLLASVRRAKEALSVDEHTEIPVSAGELSTTVHLTRPDFDTLVHGEVAEVRRLAEQVLRQAGTAPADLDVLYLTGGSSHLRAVHRTVEELLGGRPAGTLNDPKTVVALGAHLLPAEAVGEGSSADPPGDALLPPTAPPPPAPSSPAPSSPAPSSPAMQRAYRPAAGGLASAARQLLRNQPRLAELVRWVPEAKGWLEHEANLVALVAVPGLLDRAVSGGQALRQLLREESVAAPASPGSIEAASEPARVFLGRGSAWYDASHTRDLQLDVVSRVGGATGLAVALVREWTTQDALGRQQLYDQPGMLHLVAPWWQEAPVPYLQEGQILLVPTFVPEPENREAAQRPPAAQRWTAPSTWSAERHLIVAGLLSFSVVFSFVGLPYLVWALVIYWKSRHEVQG